MLVNTCGFVEQAKKDSVDALLEAADLKGNKDGRRHGPQSVVAVGCLAERYGAELAESLPEADAVLGFDDYPDIAARLRSIVAGEKQHAAHPQDRRRLLPISPVDREAAPIAPRSRLTSGPMAPLKLASGCDRRCTFCAIPSFRGSFVSRRPTDVIDEARWLASDGVRELFLVSENSTSYGKDLGDLRLLETLLPELASIEGVERVRVSYLQPAELRPGLLEAIATTPGVAPYFDLSFQHASNAVLRRMRRFGDPESFLGLLDRIRSLAPTAGVRSNVIVGFPGETEQDLETLCDFLVAARLDVTGVFGVLRRGRHRGRDVRRQARRGRGPRPHRPGGRPGRGADRPARRGADRRGRRGPGRGGPGRGGRRPRRPPGPGRRRHHDSCRQRRRRSATWCRPSW